STTIKSRVTKISLALSSRRDNHLLAATAKMAILIVAEFSSRLSRYTSRCADRVRWFRCPTPPRQARSAASRCGLPPLPSSPLAIVTANALKIM
ncbi:MAG: hypothetical protein NTV56_16770, partial [Alphaproteobacteria bacterium]|nr:hypothetical protein [Alphaproteobacteria bacterium]